MYCERCGKAIDDSLNYCNGCGAQLKRESGSGNSNSKAMVAFLTAGLVSIAVVGLGVLVGVIAIMLDTLQKPELVFTFSVVYLITLFAICFMMMRQISKLIDADLRSRNAPFDSRQSVQLPQRSTNQLGEFREPASVTDHTTRTLDKIPLRDS